MLNLSEFVPPPTFRTADCINWNHFSAQ